MILLKIGKTNFYIQHDSCLHVKEVAESGLLPVTPELTQVPITCPQEDYEVVENNSLLRVLL